MFSSLFFSLFSNWKTTLTGLAFALMTEAAIYLTDTSGAGWHLLAMGLAAVAAMSKDSTKHGAPPPPPPAKLTTNEAIANLAAVVEGMKAKLEAPK